MKNIRIGRYGIREWEDMIIHVVFRGKKVLV